MVINTVPVLQFEIIVELLGPAPSAANVQSEEILHFWSWADSEGVPFECSNLGYLREIWYFSTVSSEILGVTHFNENPITGREIEVVRPLYDETSNVGGEHDARGDDTLAPAVSKPGEDPEHELTGKHNDWCYHPEPGEWCMESQEDKVGNVEEVCEVKYLWMIM